MKLVKIYQCLGDETRLRILNLLAQRSLCVCHLQEILGRPQAQISQHLARMKKDGIVEPARYHNWMIYALPKVVPSTLQAHLKCLEVVSQSEADLRRDLNALKKLKKDCDWIDEVIRSKASPTMPKGR